MLRPDFATAPTQATAPTAATVATVRAAAPMPAAFASAGSSSGGFAALFGEVQNDVADFIENGSHGASLASMAPSSYSMAAMNAEADGASRNLRASLLSPASPAEGAGSEQQQDFLASIAPYAADAGQRLGVAPELVAAHAALESGWGQKPLRQPGGADTHNLFGIKAGGSWQGDVAQALTTEHVDGANVRKVEPFRSYSDPASGFRDYAQLLLDNPRYRAALNTGSDARAFAQGLARGGYATDPGYADKLARVAARIQQSGR